MPGYVCSDRPTGPVLNSIDVARLWAEVMGEPDAGRHMPSWARQAGFEKIESSASAWCYAGPQDRPWWGASWAERLTESPFGDRAVEHGLATRADLERLAAVGGQRGGLVLHPARRDSLPRPRVTPRRSLRHLDASSWCYGTYHRDP
jgi:hypothetical protein